MFEIIGYWFGVSLITFVLLYWPILLLSIGLIYATTSGIPDYSDKTTFRSFLMKKADKYFGWDWLEDNVGKNGVGIQVTNVITCAVMWIMYGLLFMDLSQTPVESTHIIASTLSPVFSLIGVIGAVYITFHLLSKWIYKAYKLSQEFTEHKEDKTIHNEEK